MCWSAALLALLVSHLVGDVLLQTEQQALAKRNGLGDAIARKALLQHLATYMLAYLPALCWVAGERTVIHAVTVGAVVAGPHLLIDDGRLVQAWIRDVKRALEPPLALSIAVDQSFHVVCLLGAALVATS